MEPVNDLGIERSRLRIRLRSAGAAVVVRLDGRLTVDADLVQLRALAEWAASRDRRLVALDLGGVRDLDCAGLGDLAAFCASVIEARGRCALVSVERRQMMLMERAGLLAIVPAFGDEKVAMNWFCDATAAPPAADHGPWLGGRPRPYQAFGSTHAADRSE